MLAYFGSHIRVDFDHFNRVFLSELAHMGVGEGAGWVPGCSEVDQRDGKLLDRKILVEELQILETLDLGSAVQDPLEHHGRDSVYYN